MEQFASRYGTAAHLAILAVAPLFLFPFCVPHTIAIVLLWLSAFAAIWILMLPSVRFGEPTHIARERVLRAWLRDPLSWVGLALVALAAIRTLNGGIVLSYDTEATAWSLSLPALRWLPGSVAGAGFPAFCAAVAAWVVLSGARHALDLLARRTFRAWVSVLSGLAALLGLAALVTGNAVAQALAACNPADPAYAGTAFGVLALVSLAAVGEAAEDGRPLTVLLTAASMLLDALALVAFAPVSTACAFLTGVVILFVLQFVYVVTCGPLRRRWILPVTFAFVATFFLFCVGRVLAGTPAAPRVPERVVADKTFFPAGFAETRAALSDAAADIWRTAPWTGRGLGSFPEAVRFAGDAGTWKAVRFRPRAPWNGYLGVLAERGIIGLGAFAVVLALLVWTYVRSFAPDDMFLPPLHPVRALLPLALLLAAAVSAKDGSFVRADVMLATLVPLAVPVRDPEEEQAEVSNG